MPERHATTLVAITRHLRGQKPQQMGTGVLVTLFGKYFLLSATHVLDEPGIALPGTPLWEAGRIFVSVPPGGDPKEDKLDIGYILLNDETVKRLRDAGRTFLAAHDVPINVEGLRDTVYVFSGFPASHSTTRMRPLVVESTPIFIRGDGLRPERMLRLNRDPKLYVGIDYDRERQFDEEKKVRITGPMPEGMSGGAVWLILPNGTPVLMALGTDYDPAQRVLFGTYLQPLIRKLKEQYDSSGGISGPEMIVIPDRLFSAVDGVPIRVQLSASTHGPMMVAPGVLTFLERTGNRAIAKITFSTGKTRFLTQAEINRLTAEADALFLPLP